MLWIIPVIIVVIVAIGLVKCVCIVPQANEWVLEVLGQYSGTWESGLHLKPPIIARVAKKVSLKEQVADFEPQPVITKDNVTMMVDSVVFFRIFDTKLFTYGAERPIGALENLAATTLRNIIGSMTLDETLTSRDSINSQITKILDEATDQWGLRVSRVEVKNIQPPQTIREAMEKQMRAEREKREKILSAEGEKQSAIMLAEGEKEAAVLRAEAARERMVREAQGQAEALLTVQRAQAESIELINKAAPSAQYLQLEQYKAAANMANGQATKIIVPTNLANLVGDLSTIAEVAKPVLTATPSGHAPQQPSQQPQGRPVPPQGSNPIPRSTNPNKGL